MTAILILAAIVLVATVVLTTIYDPRKNSGDGSAGARDNPDPYDNWLRSH